MRNPFEREGERERERERDRERERERERRGGRRERSTGKYFGLRSVRRVFSSSYRAMGKKVMAASGGTDRPSEI